MKKVLIVAPSRKTRGGITAVVSMYEASSIWAKWQCYWIETHIDASVVKKMYYFLKAFFTYISKVSHYDIIHIHLSEPVSAIRKLFFFSVAKMFKKKTIIHFHSFSPDSTLNSNFRFLYKFLFSNSDVVFVLSESWKKSINESLNISKNVRILYNPASLDKGIQNKVEDHKYILFAGTLNDRKGFIDLLKAFSRVSCKYQNWKLIFAGNGNLERGIQLSVELGIKEKVEFKGWVSGDNKDRLFRNATIFCLPSYAEGFPMAVIDAIAYKIPVVATPVGGLPDLFVNDKDIKYFNSGNILELSECLEQLIINERFRNTLALNAYAIANDNFTLSKVVNVLDSVYSEL